MLSHHRSSTVVVEILSSRGQVVTPLGDRDLISLLVKYSSSRRVVISWMNSSSWEKEIFSHHWSSTVVVGVLSSHG